MSESLFTFLVWRSCFASLTSRRFFSSCVFASEVFVASPVDADSVTEGAYLALWSFAPQCLPTLSLNTIALLSSLSPLTLPSFLLRATCFPMAAASEFLPSLQRVIRN